MRARLSILRVGIAVLLTICVIMSMACASPTPVASPTQQTGPTSTPWVIVVTATPTSVVPPTVGPSPTPAPTQPAPTATAQPTPPLPTLEPYPPTVRILTPGNGAEYTAGQVVSVQFSAGDQSGISQVILYVGQTGVASRDYAQRPTSISQDTLEWTPSTAGNYTLRAIAYDTFSTPSNPDERSIVVKRKATTPAVYLDSPAQPRTVVEANHAVSFQATIHDEAGVQNLELVQSKGNQETVLTSDSNYHNTPFTWQTSYQWSDADLGDRTVFVRARDANGGQGQSNSVVIAVADDYPPTIHASYSATSLSPGNDLKVHVEATDSKGVTQLQLVIDGNVVDTWQAKDQRVGQSHASHDLYWRNVSSGNHTAHVWGRDSTGKQAQTPDQGIQVGSAPPPPNLVGTWVSTDAQFTLQVNELRPNQVKGLFSCAEGQGDFYHSSFDGHNASIKAHLKAQGLDYIFTLTLSGDGRTLNGSWLVLQMGLKNNITFVKQ